jgi:hypothetical protein
MTWYICKFNIKMLKLAKLCIRDINAARADCLLAIFLIANPKFAPILAKGTMLKKISHCVLGKSRVT